MKKLSYGFKRFTIILVMISFVFMANSQIKLETQIGGSNFLGCSINTSYDFYLTADHNQKLVPKIGFGMRYPDLLVYGLILTDLNYEYKNLGGGVGMSKFFVMANPENIHFLDIELLVYPNLNYTFNLKSNWYLKVSAGAYFAFNQRDRLESPYSLEFAGDVIPGGGIGFGYKF